MITTEELANIVREFEALHYENAAFRMLLAELNPPGWETSYAELMTDWKLREQHHRQLFAELFAALDRQETQELVEKLRRARDRR